MIPTFNREGDVVLVDHVSRAFGRLERGDVVIAVCPYEPRKLVCKRLVAMEGDALPSPLPAGASQRARAPPRTPASPRATSGSRATTSVTPPTRETTARCRTTSFAAASFTRSGRPATSARSRENASTRERASERDRSGGSKIMYNPFTKLMKTRVLSRGTPLTLSVKPKV